MLMNTITPTIGWRIRGKLSLHHTTFRYDERPWRSNKPKEALEFPLGNLGSKQAVRFYRSHHFSASSVLHTSDGRFFVRIYLIQVHFAAIFAPSYNLSYKLVKIRLLLCYFKPRPCQEVQRIVTDLIACLRISSCFQKQADSGWKHVNVGEWLSHCRSSIPLIESKLSIKIVSLVCSQFHWHTFTNKKALEVVVLN